MSRRMPTLQRGFVLLSVVVMLAVLASLVLMVSSTSNSQRVASETLSNGARLEYAAQSALEYAQWTLNQQDTCDNYPDITDIELGDMTIRAEVTPKSGTPVSVSAEAAYGDEAFRRIAKSGLTMYNRSSQGRLTIRSTAKIKDSFIEGNSGHLDHNKGDDKSIDVNGETGGLDRGLLEFDLSDVPPGAHIESALLQLEVDKLGSEETVSVHRIEQSWVESEVTWEERAAGENWNAPGGYYSQASVAAFEVSALGLVTVDVTEAVRAWAAGQFPNYGFMLVTEESSSARENAFTSSDDNAGVAPSLEIVYVCPCGSVCPGTDNSPVAHWRLDDGRGLVAVDAVGGHDGVLVNGPVWLEPGQVDDSLEFDGSNDHVLVTHDDELSFTEAMTMTAWVYMVSDDMGSGYDIVSKETPGANDNYWLTLDQDGLLLGIDGTIFATNNLWSAGRWYHVAATYDLTTSEVRLYVDGEQELVQVTSVELAPNEEPLYLGTNWEKVRPLKGQLDDVRLYSRALSGEEIDDVYKEAELDVASNVYQTYRDRFNERAFDGNDGTLNWSTDWLEIGESNGAVLSDISVRSYIGHDFSLRIRDNDNGGEGVQREFDLSACAAAHLAFDYRRDGLDQSSDYVALSLSSAGDSNWTEVVRFEGPGDDVGFAHYTIDLAPYASTNTRMRLLTSPSLGGLDEVWFDNVTVTCE